MAGTPLPPVVGQVVTPRHGSGSSRETEPGTAPTL